MAIHLSKKTLKIFKERYKVGIHKKTVCCRYLWTKNIYFGIWNSINVYRYMAGIQKSLKNSKPKITVYKAPYENFGIWVVYKPKKAV